VLVQINHLFHQNSLFFFLVEKADVFLACIEMEAADRLPVVIVEKNSTVA
jgi:hypothetical protein